MYKIKKVNNVNLNSINIKKINKFQNNFKNITISKDIKQLSLNLMINKSENLRFLSKNLNNIIKYINESNIIKYKNNFNIKIYEYFTINEFKEKTKDLIDIGEKIFIHIGGSTELLEFIELTKNYNIEDDNCPILVSTSSTSNLNNREKNILRLVPNDIAQVLSFNLEINQLLNNGKAIEEEIIIINENSLFANNVVNKIKNEFFIENFIYNEQNKINIINQVNNLINNKKIKYIIFIGGEDVKDISEKIIDETIIFYFYGLIESFQNNNFENNLFFDYSGELLYTNKYRNKLNEKFFDEYNSNLNISDLCLIDIINSLSYMPLSTKQNIDGLIDIISSYGKYSGPIHFNNNGDRDNHTITTYFELENRKVIKNCINIIDCLDKNNFEEYVLSYNNLELTFNINFLGIDDFETWDYIKIIDLYGNKVEYNINKTNFYITDTIYFENKKLIAFLPASTSLSTERYINIIEKDTEEILKLKGNVVRKVGNAVGSRVGLPNAGDVVVDWGENVRRTLTNILDCIGNAFKKGIFNIDVLKALLKDIIQENLEGQKRALKIIFDNLKDKLKELAPAINLLIRNISALISYAIELLTPLIIDLQDKIIENTYYIKHKDLKLYLSLNQNNRNSLGEIKNFIRISNNPKLSVIRLFYNKYNGYQILHHGNQNANNAFPVLEPFTFDLNTGKYEKHQFWIYENEIFKSFLDDKFLSINGNNVIMSTNSNTDNSKWIIENNGDGTGYLKNKATNKYLLPQTNGRFILGEKTQDCLIDLEYIIPSKSLNYNKQFSLTKEPINEIDYNKVQGQKIKFFFNDNKGFSVLHHGNQNANNAFPVLEPFTDEKHQKWIYENQTLKSELDGKFLSISNNNVVMSTDGISNNSKWIIEEFNNNKAYLKNVGYNAYLSPKSDGTLFLTPNPLNSEIDLEYFYSRIEFKNLIGFDVLHHGNQSKNNAFPVLQPTTDEKHQRWQYINESFKSQLDGKYLSIDTNYLIMSPNLENITKWEIVKVTKNKLSDFFNTLWENLQNNSTIQFLTLLLKELLKSVKSGIKYIFEFLSFFGNAISSFQDNLSGVFDALVSYLSKTEIFNTIKQDLSNMSENAKIYFKRFFEYIISKLDEYGPPVFNTIMNIINFIIDLGIIQGSLEQLKLLTDFIIDNFNNIDYNIIKLVLKNIAKFLNLTTETLSFIAQIITPFIDFFIEKLPDLIEILGLNETNETDEPAKNAQNAQIITDFIQILISPQKLSKEFITTVFNLLIKFLQELFSDSINQIEFYLKKLINSINPEYFQNILQSIKDIFLPNIQDNTKKNDILGILLGIIISFIGEENFKLIQDQLGSIFENIKNNIQKLKSILIPIIEKLSKSITDFKDLISNLICILKGFVETIIDFIETLQLIFEIIDKAVNFDSLSSFLQSLFKIFQEYFFSPELLKEILNSVMDFIARIISKIPIDEFFNKIKEIFEPLLDNFGIKKVDNDDDVEKLIKDIIGKIFKNLKTISDAIFSISISVLQIIITFFNISVGVIDKILTFVTPYLIPLIQGIKQIINTITNVLKSILTFLKAIYKSFDAIVESLDTLFDKIEDYKNYDQLKADSTFKNVTDNINTSLNNNPTSNNQTANKDIFNIILELIK